MLKRSKTATCAERFRIKSSSQEELTSTRNISGPEIIESLMLGADTGSFAFVKLPKVVARHESSGYSLGWMRDSGAMDSSQLVLKDTGR